MKSEPFSDKPQTDTFMSSGGEEVLPDATNTLLMGTIAVGFEGNNAQQREGGTFWAVSSSGLNQRAPAGAWLRCCSTASQCDNNIPIYLRIFPSKCRSHHLYCCSLTKPRAYLEEVELP